MKKYHLLFDGTILINEFSKNDARSGIFFVTKNLFFEFLKRDDIKLFLYCDLSKYPLLKKYLEAYNLENKIEIINAQDFDSVYKLKHKARSLKNQYNKKTQPIKRTGANILYAIISLFSKIKEAFCGGKYLKQKLKNIDFYFSPCQKTPTIIRKTKNIISSVYLHDTIPLLFPSYFPRSFTGKHWFVDLIKTIGKDNLYFANSECTKNDFIKFFLQLADKGIIVAPLAANSSFQKYDDLEKIKTVKEKYHISGDKKYIFSLCTLEPRKNLIRAVKTFIQFIEKNNIDDLFFVLGGGHWDTFIGKLEQEVQNLGKYKDKIIHAGYIDDEDLPVLYSGAEWFVYTSQYEGFGLPPLEAMSCGCPVITSNSSSIPEVVGDAGIMIDWNSDEQHIEAYEKYYFNPNSKAQNALKGIERAKWFSWKKTVDLIVGKMIECQNFL